MTTVVDPDGQVVEIAPGRGDLNRTSQPFSPADSELGIGGNGLSLIGGRTVSCARIFGTQQVVAAQVMRLLTYAARVPLKAYRRTGEDSRERLRRGDHPVAAAIAEPWERGSQLDFVHSLLGPVLVHGNALNEIEQGARNRIRFTPADWRYAVPIQSWRGALDGWELDVDSEDWARRSRSVDNVLHCAWWSPLGPVGIAPLRQLGVTLRIDDAAQRHQQALLSNGARPPSAITADKEFLGLQSDERQALLAQLRADATLIYAGPENAGRPAILPPGLDWKELGHSAVEAELIEQRKLAAREVGAIYQMPPLPEDGKVSLTEWRQMAYTDALGPQLVLIEQAFNAQVVVNLLREPDIYVEFDFSAVLRGDRLKEIEALREAIASAVLTPNEARSIDNRPRSDQAGMDDFYLPRNNLWPLSVPYPATGRGGDQATATGAAS